MNSSLLPPQQVSKIKTRELSMYDHRDNFLSTECAAFPEPFGTPTVGLFVASELVVHCPPDIAVWWVISAWALVCPDNPHDSLSCHAPRKMIAVGSTTAVIVKIKVKTIAKLQVNTTPLCPTLLDGFGLQDTDARCPTIAWDPSLIN